MDITPIITRLQAECPTLSQVLAARNGGSTAPAATQAALYSLLTSVVGTRMYPLQAPENVAHPSMVYQLTSSFPAQFDGYDVLHTDQYVLMLRGQDYSELLTIADTIVGLINGQPIDVTDMLHDFDERESLYRINFELSYSYIAASAQTLPAAFVYTTSQSASPSSFDNRIKQRVSSEYAILLVTTDDNIAVLREEVQNALLGWQQTSGHHEMEYGAGLAIESVGGMAVWRDIYRDSFYITQL